MILTIFSRQVLLAVDAGAAAARAFPPPIFFTSIPCYNQARVPSTLTTHVVDVRQGLAVYGVPSPKPRPQISRYACYQVEPREHENSKQQGTRMHPVSKWVRGCYCCFSTARLSDDRICDLASRADHIRRMKNHTRRMAELLENDIRSLVCAAASFLFLLFVTAMGRGSQQAFSGRGISADC